MAVDPAPRTVRRYLESNLTEELASIKASTDSAENLLNVNAAAQTRLKSDTSGDKRLTPYMTSLGFEVEFAQQSDTVPTGASEADVVLKSSAANRLDNAHIEVARSDGLALYESIPFVMETDAGKALEFVTPPLLAPLTEGGKGATDVIPDPAWEKAATRALEFGIKRRVKDPLTIESFVDGVNTDWPVTMAFSDAAFKSYVYGPIRKESPASHTNAQLNYMTTLRHYAEVNMSGVGGLDPETQKVLSLLWETGGLSATFEGGEDKAALRAYAFVVSQKLREIPSGINDYIFAKILAADTVAPQSGSMDEKAVTWSQENINATWTHRRLLAFEASKIKDQAQLWLKASYHQILAAVPAKYRAPIVEKVTQQKDPLIDLLAKARVFPNLKSSLMRYYGDDESRVKQAITLWFEHALANTSGEELDEKASWDARRKPKEQKDKSGRASMVGARADTYVPADAEIAEEPLFLVETRMPTTYLELAKGDRFRFHEALAQVEAEVDGVDNKVMMRQYFDLRVQQDAAKIPLVAWKVVETADAYLQLVTSKAKSLDLVAEQIRSEVAEVDRREPMIAYVAAGEAVAEVAEELSTATLLEQANQLYEEI